MKRDAVIILIVILLLILASFQRADANPYLAKPGEAPLPIRVSNCAVSGGFTHMYAAIDARLFEKYGLRTELIYIQGSGPGLTALTTNEIQFRYCAGDATIPGLASGVDAKLVGSLLVGMPYMLLARKDIKRVEDLKGKSIGYSRPGQVDHRLARAINHNSFSGICNEVGKNSGILIVIPDNLKQSLTKVKITLHEKLLD